MTLPHLKSIPAGLCKLNRLYSVSQRKLCMYNLPHTDKEVHEAFYGKYNGIFRTCANNVYQASPRGEGPGDEATSTPACVHAEDNYKKTHY